MPAKRKNTVKQAGNGNAKQAKQEGQKAVSHDINVPIDEGFQEGRIWTVSYSNWQDLHPVGSLPYHQTYPTEADRPLIQEMPKSISTTTGLSSMPR